MTHTTITLLREMRFSAMASELEKQLADPAAYNQLGFEDRLSLLVDAEWNRRQVNKLERYIRGLNPWPSAYTYKDGKMMKLWSASVSYEKFEPCPCGTLVSVEDGMLWIMTGDGVLQIKELQPEGKRRMTTEEYLRGYPLAPGVVFGS